MAGWLAEELQHEEWEEQVEHSNVHPVGVTKQLPWHLKNHYSEYAMTILLIVLYTSKEEEFGEQQ